MVRKRGGGTGRGQDQGEKRQATTPVGGVYKDSRRNIQGDEDFEDDEEQWTTVIRSKQTTPTLSGSGSGLSQTNQPNQPDSLEHSSNPTNVQHRQQSFAQMVAGPSTSASASTTGRHEPYELPRQPSARPIKFLTPPPEGGMRDDIVIEVLTLNGAPFKGSISVTEATRGIFRDCLDLNTRLIHGLRFGYSTYPLIKFKLKEQIDVDALHRVEHFNFERHYTANGRAMTDILACKIKGIRTPGNEGEFHEPDSDPNIRWVKIEWADYGLTEEQIVAWMEVFGEKAGELTEDLHPMPPNSDSEAEAYCSGTYSIKMRLRTDMPQIIPMCGKRIRVYHKGIQKLCTNCFGAHQRRNCKSAKVPWIEYVLHFMEKYPDIPKELYGRWWKVINDEYGEIVCDQPELTPVQNTNMEQSSNTYNELSQPHSEPDPRNTREQTGTRSTPTVGFAQSNTSTASVPTQGTLSRLEEENLSDYLDLGLSISEAREQYRIEQHAAEIRYKIRENKRNQTRGAVNATRHTATGMTSTRGRGGLSFN